MIKELYLIDFNRFSYYTYKQIFRIKCYKMKNRNRSHLTDNTGSATRNNDNRHNQFTYFRYGWIAHKIYLWICDNKDIIHETPYFGQRNDFLFSFIQLTLRCIVG